MQQQVAPLELCLRIPFPMESYFLHYPIIQTPTFYTPITVSCRLLTTDNSLGETIPVCQLIKVGLRLALRQDLLPAAVWVLLNHCQPAESSQEPGL